MKSHDQYKELLPFYINGQLDQTTRAKIEQHLSTCSNCQAEMALWNSIADQITNSSSTVQAPPNLAAQALDHIHTRRALLDILQKAWSLLQTQAMLIQHNLWLSCAAIMAMGIIVALLAQKQEIIYFLAPLVAAGSLSAIYGPEVDPASELLLSTPTSPWKILLARLTLVSGYNLILALIASTALLSLVPPHFFGSLIQAWFGPMAFLSALALLLSLWIGTTNAIATAYTIWIIRYLPFKASRILALPSFLPNTFSSYQLFWQNTILLVILALFLAVIALFSVKHAGRFHIHQAA